MDTPAPHPRTWPTALVATVATACVLALVCAAAMAFGLRDDAARTADALHAEGQRIAAAVDGAPAAAIRTELADAGVAARVVGPRGELVADGNLTALWNAGTAPFAARAAVWRSGATVGHGVVEEVVPLGDGRTLIVRAPLAMGTGGIASGLVTLAVLVALLSLAAGAVAWRRAVARARHLDERADALLAASAGRGAPRAVPPAGAAFAGLDHAVERAARRIAELQGAAEARMEALGAALAPMPLPVAARTPSGGLVRNDALERLVRSASIADADRLEDALRRGLDGSGAVSRRVELDDGRVIEAEAWAVPGGRLVALAERTEQQRLRELRAEISRAATRIMRGPVADIRTQSRALAERLGGADGEAARAILAASDRVERVSARILRADGADDAARAAQVRPVGLPSVAFGLGRAYDGRLRERGLRLEHDIPDGLAPLLADPGLLHEVLAELIDNAAAATGRGGVLTLRARPAGPRTVEIVVADTGSGIPGRERALVMEPFGRGVASRTRPGAGLGLGVARTLVERMGGSLSVETGAGGRVRLEMPSQAQAHSPIAPSAAPDAGGAPGGAGAALSATATAAP